MPVGLRVDLRGEAVGADGPQPCRRRCHIGWKEKVSNLIATGVADMDEAIVAAGDIGLDLERGIGRYQRDELLARLQHRAHRHLGHRQHRGRPLRAQLDELSAQRSLVQ